MKITKEDIQRIIAEKKTRLEQLSNPNIWHIYTKNMESGEYKAFKQSCIDDEIIIVALEKMLKEYPTEKDELADTNVGDIKGSERTKEKLIQILADYFELSDTYAYNLTRDKQGFTVGTITIDDFEEFNMDMIADIADYLIKNGGTIEHPIKRGGIE